MIEDTRVECVTGEELEEKRAKNRQMIEQARLRGDFEQVDLYSRMQDMLENASEIYKLKNPPEGL